MASRNLVKHHGLVEDKRGAKASNGGFLYAALPMELARDGKLSYTARSVALYIWSHDQKWQQSASAVAEALDMDRGAVGKALTDLQEAGWLVREIHQTIGPSGKPRTAWERWHLQMSNVPFTADEVRELSGPQDVRVKPAPPTQGCGLNQHGGAVQTSTGGADETSTIEMQFRNAPEVHSSNARTTPDEDRFEGGPLAVEGSEATEETEGYRPEGLVGTQPSTAEGPQWSGPKEKPAPPAEPEPTARQQSCRRQSAATQVASATAADITSRAFIEAEDPWASVPANQKESA